MKNFITASILSVFFILTSCLTFDSFRVQIHFLNDNYSRADITLTYFGLSSDADSLHKRQSDFDEIISSYQDDDFLLDELENGIYVKKRDIFEDEKGVGFRYSGIFKTLKLDGTEFKIQKDNIVFELDKDDMNLVDTNGEVSQDSAKIYITWPKGTTDIYWESKSMEKDGELYSLVPFFRKWKAAQQ